MSLLHQAITIAVNAHQRDKDKAGRTYILHPLRVMFRMDTEDEMIVAVLHDVVEDHGGVWPLKRLRKLGFPKRILDALDCVTKRKGERYDRFIQRSASNPLALRVKLADLEDNLDVRRLPEVTPKARRRINRYLAAYRRLRGL